MFRLLCAGICMFISLSQGMNTRHVSAGPLYSSYLLYQDDEDAVGIWRFGGEIGVINLIPHIGFKVRAAVLEYAAPSAHGPDKYEFWPVSFCTSFDLLPFLDSELLGLSLETGIGVFFWKGFYNDAIIELPNGELMDERDIGFIAGLTLQLRPIERIGIELGTRYNYIASADLYKYGYSDKDDKIWENGISLKALLPW
jgi:hypothetical protein